MAKTKTQYVCQNCGATYLKWQGQCNECGQWNTLVEETVAPVPADRRAKVGLNQEDLEKKIVSFSQVKLTSGEKHRFFTGIGELDRCLGGGLVGGMVILLGGEPGIGKSTLLTQMILQILGQMAIRSLPTQQGSQAVTKKRKTTDSNYTDQSVQNKSTVNAKSEPQSAHPSSKTNYQVFYIAGEESPSQIMLRINRLLNNEQFLKESGLLSTSKDSGATPQDVLTYIRENLYFVTTTDADEIAQLIQTEKPSLVIVDSIQTLSTTALTGASGSVGQIRESADRIITVAKAYSIPCFLVGHITKEGEIAGPKILEHMVDSVMILEGERSGQLRLLRSLKNRFGPTDEVGIFQSEDYGLVEVTNPSALFLENSESSVIGAATVCLMEGSRPLLAEVQALVVKSQLAMPRRVGRGIDLARIQVLSAVLQRHARLPLAFYDVFLSVAGGFRIQEAAVDLGLAMAIASSLSGKKIPQNIVFVGEIGLLGEIRKTPYFERRAKEARRLGFSKIISADTHHSIFTLLKEFGMTARHAEAESTDDGEME